MDKKFNELYSEEEQWNERRGEEFRNEFVENGKDTATPLQALSDNTKDSELGPEPNGMDPVDKLQKGFSFQEEPSEFRSQGVAQFGIEPNGVNPNNKKNE
ncbi:hypothetical protein QTL97_09510 [Sporosarcina thermotolerans]|uniref:Uncharacterized protein n=1 Tax=Sporosarcina thermotolerans TaxID=633404 RepID=A0AAW9A966_9BACL|nr:hypothetical protein [Sporosarcina thermotolerans]MDW0117173.1 hypothetical protein [Sporosarcina thermotolerans]WHT47344.1 hypothetical protein QNH10_14200 [Sporosarcina thermotolerans]